LPFEVDLTPELLATLKKSPSFGALERRQSVSNLSYMGDEGGIICHIQPPNDANQIVTSITHIRVPAYLPFAPDVADYQKHRVKKLRKLHSE
jgi:hypothetical protein